MRLWSIHPEYLDTKGLVALWREGLLAKKVLENKTIGYQKHPQLNRFKECKKPLAYIKFYLHLVCDEAEVRGYSFDRTKLGRRVLVRSIFVTSGQCIYEWNHFLKKIKVRSPKLFKKLNNIKNPKLHPLFKKKRGPVETWEVSKRKS